MGLDFDGQVGVHLDDGLPIELSAANGGGCPIKNVEHPISIAGCGGRNLPTGTSLDGDGPYCKVAIGRRCPAVWRRGRGELSAELAGDGGDLYPPLLEGMHRDGLRPEHGEVGIVFVGS